MQKLPSIVKFIRKFDAIYADVWNARSVIRTMSDRKDLVVKGERLCKMFLYIYELKSNRTIEFIKSEMEEFVTKYSNKKTKYSNWELLDKLRDKCIEYQEKEAYINGMRDCLMLSLFYLNNMYNAKR